MKLGILSGLLMALTLTTACTTAPSTSPPTLAGDANAVAKHLAETLYAIGNRGGVALYAEGSARPYRTIKQGIAMPSSLAVDRAGTVYVANIHNLRGYVSVYAAGSDVPERRISLPHSGFPNSIAVDDAGTVYVVFFSDPASRNGPVLVYPKSGAPYELRVRGFMAQSLTLDRDRNVYVGYSDPTNDSQRSIVAKYAPGSVKPQFAIRGDLGRPMSLAVDAGGNLYVAVDSLPGHALEIFVYGSGGTTPLRRLPAQDAIAMTFDRDGNLYAANSLTNTVTEFSPGASEPSRTIARGISYPSSLATDSTGNLYVANYYANTITVYAPGSTTPSRTIRDHVFQPFGIAIAATDASL